MGLMPDYLEGISLRSLGVICADLTARRESFLLDAEHVAPKRLPIVLTVAAAFYAICFGMRWSVW